MAVGTNGTGTRPRADVAEIIGRNGQSSLYFSLYNSRGAVVSVDETRPDYAFYDLLRRGKQPGYKLGALFAKRIEHIFAVWILGRGVTVKLAESGNADNDNDPRNMTDVTLADFLEANQTTLMDLKEDALGLGDQYIFVNPDGTLSVPSPDTVEEIRDERDYRNVLSVKITTKLPKGITIEDVYTATERTVTVKEGSDSSTQRFAVLIGRIPYIHITHGRSGNETNGHSIHEDLLKLYDQYDDVIHKQLDGAKLLGNPIPTISGLEDLAAVIDANKPAVNADYYDRDGNLVTRPEINIDNKSLMLIGKGGKFEMVAPPIGFSADTQQSLKTLFLLLLDRTGIPEFIWGNELSGSHATSDTQMEQWARDIEGQQKHDAGWLIDLCDIWLLMMALTDPTMIADELKAEWPPVLDDSQELRLKTLQYASSENLLADKTKLKLTSLPVDDLDKELSDAQGEAQARRDDEQARMEAQAAVTPAQRAVAAQELTEHAEREKRERLEAERSVAVRAAIREEAERMLADA